MFGVERGMKMGLLEVLNQRVGIVSFCGILIILSLFLILAIWKNRFNISKTLIVVTTTICTSLLLLSVFLLIFSISFGFNS